MKGTISILSAFVDNWIHDLISDIMIIGSNFTFLSEIGYFHRKCREAKSKARERSIRHTRARQASQYDVDNTIDKS